MKPFALALAWISLLVGSTAGAQEYPTRTITLIVPFAAGGPTDVMARLVGQHMAQTLGQQIVVENVTGAGGTLGSARGAKASPDGYTLTTGSLGSHAAGYSYYKNIQYDPRELEPIGLVAGTPSYFVVRKDFQPTTCDLAPTVVAQIQAGTIRGLMLAQPERARSTPDVPTSREAGLPDYVLTGWNAMFAPKGTPKPVLDRLSAALRAAVMDGAVRSRIEELGSLPPKPEEMSSEWLRQTVRSDVEKWGKVIREAGLGEP